MVNTLGAIERGELAPLAQVVEGLAQPDGDDFIALALRSVLGLVRALGVSDLDAEVPSGLGAQNVAQLEAALAKAVGRFVEPPAGTPEATDRLAVFAVVGQAVHQCPEGSLTSTLRTLLGDEVLVGSLLVLVADQRFIDFFSPLLDPASGDAGRRGVVTLLATIFDLLGAEPFDFASLASVFGLIIPEDEPPMREFLLEFERVLVGDGLDNVQSAVRCIDAIEIQDSTANPRSGTDIIGDALYEVLAAFGPDPSALLDLIGSDAGAFAIIDQFLVALDSDETLKADLIDLIDVLLLEQNVRPIVEGLHVLLEVGALTELFALVEVFLGDGCSRDLAELERSLELVLRGGTR